MTMNVIAYIEPEKVWMQHVLLVLQAILLYNSMPCETSLFHEVVVAMYASVGVWLWIPHPHRSQL